MNLDKIDEVWNSANPLFKWRFDLLSSRNFATMATWRKDFSSLLVTGWREEIKKGHFMYCTSIKNWGKTSPSEAQIKFWIIHNFISNQVKYVNPLSETPNLLNNAKSIRHQFAWPRDTQQTKIIHYGARRPQPRRSETGIKRELWRNGTKISVTLEYSFRKNRTTPSNVPLLQEIFCRNNAKNRVSFTFQPDFQETVNGKQPLFAFG